MSKIKISGGGDKHVAPSKYTEKSKLEKIETYPLHVLFFIYVH